MVELGELSQQGQKAGGRIGNTDYSKKSTWWLALSFIETSKLLKEKFS